jgi:hypothetical protein
MSLTNEERQFLDAYVYEVTHEPFGGPATRDLGQRNVRYSDLDWILTAYQRELSAAGVPAAGVRTPEPPPSPWRDLEEVTRRSKALKNELEPAGTHGSADPDGKCTGGSTPALAAEEVARYEKLKDLFDLEEAKRILATERDQGRPLADILHDLRAQESRQ